MRLPWVIRPFQPALRKGLHNIPAWREKIAEVGDLGLRAIEYDLGYRKIMDDVISIHHDDVLTLMATFLPNVKFQSILAGRYPYIFIDEYQDTSS